MDMLRVSAGRLVDLVLPPRCPGCGVVTPADHRFCLGCWRLLEFLAGPACARCGVPFDRDRGSDAQCGACLADPPACDRVRTAVAYGAIARRVVVRLKHAGRPGLAETIARQMDRLVEENTDALIVPVPLHRWRIWRRGYNQSALIARALARRRGLTLALDLLRRTRATPMLRGMGPAARARAVRGVFAVRPGQRDALAGRIVLLVDDVYTTGSTANACARTLKRAGAAEVRLIAWARVIPDGGGDDPAWPG